MNRKNLSNKIALCSMMSAVSVVILFLSSLIGVGTYAGPLIASISILPVLDEFGIKTALTTFFAAAFIGIMILPDRELAVFYLLFGWYPAALTGILRIRSRFVRILIELAIYGAIIWLMYGVIVKLLGIDPGFIESAKWLNIGMAAAGALCFLLLAPLYTKFILIWRYKWRKHFIK